MGKKPVLGLVGLAWLGLAVGGCKSGCGCGGDNSAQGQTRRRADNGYAKAWGQKKTQHPADQQQQPAPEEGAVAAKGVDPRSQPAYNFPVNERDVPREQENVAEQVQKQPSALPHDLSPENTAAMKRSAATPEVIQTGRTETPATPQTLPDAQGQAAPRSEGAVPPTVGAGVGDVVPHRPAVASPSDPMGGPAPPAPPSVEKVGGGVPPPPPTVGTAAGSPTSPIPEYAPAATPTASPLSAAPTAPPSGAVAPAGAVVPPTPVSPLSKVPPPSNALTNGARGETLPPLPEPPASTPPLPTIPAPTPMPTEPIR